jgi:hypothetical protein
MVDAFDRDDIASRGKTLTLPDPPWGVKEPSDPDHAITLPTPRASDLDDAQRARDLAGAMLAMLPAAERAAASDAYKASIAAGQALNQAEDELRTLSGPAPTGATVEERGQREVRRLGLLNLIPDLRVQVQVADERATVALDNARTHVLHTSGRARRDWEQARIRALRAESERLDDEAGHAEIAFHNAISIVNAWLPIADATPPVGQVAPVEPPAAPVAATKPKRRLLT